MRIGDSWIYLFFFSYVRASVPCTCTNSNKLNSISSDIQRMQQYFTMTKKSTKIRISTFLKTGSKHAKILLMHNLDTNAKIRAIYVREAVARLLLRLKSMISLHRLFGITPLIFL